MAYRNRIKFTSLQMESLEKRLVSKLNRSTILSSILFYFNKLAPTGAIRKLSKLVLTLSEREGISRGIVADLSNRSIAKHFNRSPSAISP